MKELLLIGGALLLAAIKKGSASGIGTIYEYGVYPYWVVKMIDEETGFSYYKVYTDEGSAKYVAKKIQTIWRNVVVYNPTENYISNAFLIRIHDLASSSMDFLLIDKENAQEFYKDVCSSIWRSGYSNIISEADNYIKFGDESGNQIEITAYEVAVSGHWHDFCDDKDGIKTIDI